MKVRFGYQKERGQNPFIGICSFQHFNGEKLYSDCVVDPSRGAIETEDYESYPVTPGVAENGREEGYYPENSIAYIRIYWKQIEPQRGQYDFSLVDEIIRDAKAHNQTIMLRLMAHSTCARDDVPDWLKEIMECPERPAGKRVKDSPRDVRFLEYFGQAIAELGKRYDDEPTLEMLDIALPGSWGEGCDTDKYPREDVCKLLDAHLDNFKKTNLIGQIPKTWTMEYCLERMPIGYRGDGVGEANHMDNMYPEALAKLPADAWKTGHVSFEAYFWMGEWKRMGWDLEKVIQKTLDWHISSFNPKSLPIPFEWQERVDAWVSKMGYHYTIDSVEVPDVISQDAPLAVELAIDNVGVAPIYRNLPLMLRLSGENGEKTFKTDVDIRKWLPGKTTETFSLDIKDLAKGSYTLSVGIVAPEYPEVYFATDAAYLDGYYKLCDITVE